MVIEPALINTNTNTDEEQYPNVEELVQQFKEQVNGAPAPLNRAQRRALAKKAGKKGRANANLISDTARKMDMAYLIQEIRKLNEKNNKGENENEQATEN